MPKGHTSRRKRPFYKTVGSEPCAGKWGCGCYRETLPEHSNFSTSSRKLMKTLMPGVYTLVFTSAAQETHLEKLVIIK